MNFAYYRRAFRRSSAVRSACVLCLSAQFSTAVAEGSALDRSVHFQIPAEALEEALLTFGRQANLAVFINSAAIGERRAPAVYGTLIARTALVRLLSQAGLSYTTVGDSISVGGGAQPTTRVADQSVDTRPPRRLAAADPVAASPAHSDELEEVLVTAQKREERLMDVPQSMSVLSADTLANQDAVNLSDFANTVPGISFTTLGVGQNQVTLRGVTSGGSDNSPTVGIYIDEVPYGSSTPFALSGRFGIDVGLFDLDRIEVLRGPQGTLYGASSIGGVLKYVTAKPNTRELTADTRIGLSGTGSGGGLNYTMAAGVNVPIVADAAAVRVNGFYSHDGGYIDYKEIGTGNARDRANRSYIDGARADFLLTPTDALSIRVTGFVQNISRGADSQIDLTLTPSSRTQGSGVASLNQYRGYTGSFGQQYRQISATVNYDWERAALTSVSSYQTMRTDSIADGTAGFVPFLSAIGIGPFGALADSAELSLHKFTQEVRLASKQSDVLDWLVGGFFTHESAGDDETFITRNLAGESVQSGLYTYSLPSTFDEYAAFADLTWHLTSQFDVTGGARYARDHQAFQQFGSGPFGATSPRFTSDEGDVTYLANARYRFTDHATGYLRFATGYRPGGPAIHLPSNNTAPDHFKADRLRSYEMGLRSETADRHLAADLSIYAINWSDIQVFKIVDGFGTFTNSTSPAHIQGAELALTGRFTREFVMTGAFAYQHAYMVDADPVLGSSAGERTANVPRFTAAVNADYELPLGRLRPTVGATARYVSGRTAGYDNSASLPQYYLPKYAVADLRAGLTFNSVQLQLYVRNVFDERGQLNATLGFLQSPYAAVSILQPRTVGVSATAHF